MQRYLTDSELTDMASAAVAAYEYACEWRAAGQAARDHAMDEWGVRATPAQVATAVRLAQTQWQAWTVTAQRARA